MYKAAFAIYLLMVTYVSTTPSIGVPIESWDKLLHFLTYGIFAALAYPLVRSRKTYCYACVSIVAYSGLMEFIQYFIPGRAMSAYDMLANTMGVLLGAFIVNAVVGSKSND